jgi:Ca-activated chloride channel family protein
MVRGLVLLLGGILVAPFGFAQGVPRDSRGTQQPAPQLEIVSPGPDAYISGTTVLRATLTPPDAATRIVFSVDGKQVCDATSAPFECSWEAGAGVYAHQIRAAADLKAGGRVIKTVRTKALGFAEKVDVDIVQVIATVMDGSGHFVSGIPRSAFHLEEDGKPQTISHFGSEDVPLELIVACDVSGSMTPAISRLKSAVKEFLAAVPTRDQVTLLGFNDSIFPLTRRQIDPAERIKAVDRLAPWGATALYDVILKGVDMLGKQPGRRAMIVFSDGEDQGSHASITDVERRLQASDVTLYMIAQGRGVQVEALKGVMQRLVEPTGGRALLTDNIDQLHVAFSDLLEELSNQYLLGYESTNAKRDDVFRKIALRVDGQSRVRARQGYRAVAPK